MAQKELPPKYDPSAIEKPTYQKWLDAGVFKADVESAREPYVIVIPPPNVTAQLHMGHGLDNTIQDLLIRFERMRGREAEWLPGTDHAGIATQNVVERLLQKEGSRKEDLGREAFVERVWEHVRQTEGIILDQLKAIGSSCDWSRTRFTLDEGLSAAVNEVFVALYERGLIYRGKYIINWCPRCLTALSNEEADKKETPGKLYHLRYPIVGRTDGQADGRTGYVEVATTRPETMLGDTAVAVHPEDDRYKDIVGAELELPLTGRRIPVVADEGVDREFGTGAVKVTPAHDPLDFEIAQRQGLESINILTDSAHLNDAVPAQFQGLHVSEARKQVAAALEAVGVLIGTEEHQHSVGRCYRCDTVVEPRLSDQWFVKMRPLADKGLKAWRDGEVKFVPERMGNIYEHWMTEIRDWCISRQLWWGHRIPAWYTDDGEIIVARSEEEARKQAGDRTITQDPDVLDTWFSSQLWPFSTFGWPEQTRDLERFYPGHTLVTGPDIVFFWVARMIMMGLEFMDHVPFRTVFFHGIVRDKQHRKMSKSLGNGIDPLDVVDRYGADALRYTVFAGSAIGSDVIMDHEDLDATFAVGRNFANKIWNVGRFILPVLEGKSVPVGKLDPNSLEISDRWMLHRTQVAIESVTESLEKFRLNDAAAAVYQYLWGDLADWYVEQAKPRIYGDQPGGEVVRSILLHSFEIFLRLLHPFMPFISEELWQHLPGEREELLAGATWPEPDPTRRDEAAHKRFALVQSLVGAVRNIRAEYNVQPGAEIEIIIDPTDEATQKAIESESGTIQRLAKVSELQFGTARDEPGGSSVLNDGTSVFVPLGSAIDLDRERERLGSEVERLEGLLTGVRKKLANENFVSRAPADVVEREREKERSWTEQVESVSEKLRSLG